jgi:hypothetical protein
MRKLFRATWPIVVLLILLVLGLGALGKAWLEFARLGAHGRITRAIVLDRFQKAKSPYQIQYRYVVATDVDEQQTFVATKAVSHEIYSSAMPGGAIDIAYLPAQPEISNVVGNRYALFGDIVWATIILAAIESFVALLAYLHIKDLIANRRL